MNWFARFRKIWRPPDPNLHSAKLRHRVAGLLLLAIASFVIAIGVWPVFAAVELVDYRVRSTQNDILLLWNTAHEYDLSGFEVMCKKSSEPDTEYHSIGFREAQGGPQSGGEYFFLIDRGLAPAQTYCFRLQEKTTNGQPGEVFDRCGYGLGITPTPSLTLTAIFTNTNALTNTSSLTNSTMFTNMTAFTSVLMISGTPGIAVPQVAANAIIINNGNLTAIPTMTPVVVSPLQTPFPTAINPALTLTPVITSTPSTSLGAPITSSIPPTVTIISPFGPPPSAPISPLATIAPSSTLTQTNGTPSDGAQVSNGLASADVDSAANNVTVEPTPTLADPGYLVVTSTPAATAIALAPIFTPFPSATPPPPGLNLASIMQPGMQNIVILLLCFTFLGASGLGVVGLLTSVLYMRSRSRDQDLNGQPVLLNKPPKRRMYL
ncbi:hypothetical protein BH10CHL1_BH10CHL1_36340 [soil metagenome]